jgi:hypothetical protein
MEPVTVRTYLETAPIKTFGADYVQANGERTVIASRLRASSFAKEKAAKAVYECKWEPFLAGRKDGCIDVGQGWIDVPPAGGLGPS